jgi:micrococcal nuclease
MQEQRVGPCRVRRVIDGDTLDVRCGGRTERVRLLRIDTPEREEPGYGEARRALERLVSRREVYLAFEEPGRPERGDHGRLLAYVHAEDGNVNVEMVRQGWSRFWTRYGRGRHARQFARAEREARAKRAGLWGGFE